MAASTPASPGGGAACAWSEKGQLASSCSLQIACCHKLSLAGTDSLSSEDWKEKAGTSDREMTRLLSSQALPLFCLQPCGKRWWCFLRAGNVFQRGLPQGSCLSVFPLCACVCSRVYLYMCLHMCCYTCVSGEELRRQLQLLPQALFTFCLTHGLSLAWNSPYVLGWLSSEPQGPAYFLLPGTR